MNTSVASTINLPQVKRSRPFRALFVTTTVSGVAYYRMCNFAWNMRTWPNVSTVVWPYSKEVTIQNQWQVDIIENPEVKNILYRLVDCADVVVWQTLDFEHSFEFWLDLRARFQKPFLMEIDDYVADVPVSNEAFEGLKPGSRRLKVILEQMRQSDAVIASTPYLKEQYSDLNGNIFVVPNSIDFKEWDKAKKRKSQSDRLRIGWIGGSTHNDDLEMVRPVIEKLTQKYPNVWFYCVHGVPNSYKSMEKVYWTHKWSKINLYPRFLASFKFDIGIAPLVDNNFNRGKSNLRWLEYSVLAIPTVASPLPDFKRVIRNGESGYLADTPEQWEKALTYLVENEVRREQVGLNAYRQIKKEFNAQKWATRYMRFLKGMANGEFLSADEI